MASKRFEISYPDGSRKKVSAFRFEQMKASGEVKQLSNRCLYVGPARTFHTFVDLAQWQTQRILNPEQMKRYLERLEVIKALALKREWEREETPAAFELRLREMGMPPEGFSEAA